MVPDLLLWRDRLRFIGRGGAPPVALTTADTFGESASDDHDDWITHVRNFWRSDRAVRSRSCVISSSAVRP
jgi:hypothetical protein